MRNHLLNSSNLFYQYTEKNGNASVIACYNANNLRCWTEYCLNDICVHVGGLILAY